MARFSALDGSTASFDPISAFCSAPLLSSSSLNLHGSHSAPTAVWPRPRAWLQLPGAFSTATITTTTTRADNRRRLYSTGSASSLPVSSVQHDDKSSLLFSGAKGAEWAGWECQFSGVDAKRIAVPEDYVPEALREWDVEVWGFETLTSEQKLEGEDKSDLLYRKRGRVYPEVGCALDNLSLEVNAVTSPLEGEGIFLGSFAGGSYVLGKKPAGYTSLQLEVGLLAQGRDYGDAQTPHQTENDETEKEESRARVEFRIETAGEKRQNELTGKLGTALTVTRERKYRHEFDDGLLYKGGGLDYQKLRTLLRSKCFGEEESAPTPTELEGKWRSGPGTWTLFTPTGEEKPSLDSSETSFSESVVFDRPASYWEGSNDASGLVGDECGVLCLLLRGGVTVQAGPWLGNTDSDERWNAAAATCAKSAGKSLIGDGKTCWAVEVGWLVGGQDGMRREVLTTVLDLETMVPLGSWKGAEERVR